MPTELPLDALEMALWTRAREGHTDDNGRIVIWGTSDEFGSCDKALAAEMIGRAYPGRAVVIDD